MTRIVYLHAAKTHLSRLVDEVAAGEDIVIARSGKPIVRLVPITPNAEPRESGLLRGRIELTAGWDAPMSAREVTRFLAGPIEPAIDKPGKAATTRGRIARRAARR